MAAKAASTAANSVSPGRAPYFKLVEVLFFRRDGAGYTQEQRLTAAIPEDGAAFGGFGVAFSGDGSLLAIASTGNGAGSMGVGGSMAPVSNVEKCEWPQVSCH